MTISKNPSVSVILPVHNGELYIRDAILSILNQTYKNFELLILISATTNKESLNIINSFSDIRIRKIFCDAVDNLPMSLNRGIKESKGKFIARMDADDISLPNRFVRQIQFMEVHPEIAILGSWAKTFGAKENIIKHPTNPEELKANLLFQTSIVHPTVMMDKETIVKNNLYYDSESFRSEDVELWSRAVEKVKIANIPEVLLLYRTHTLQASHSSIDKQIEVRRKILARQLSYLGIVPTIREFEIHHMITKFQSEYTLNFLKETKEWLEKILSANLKTKKYNNFYLCKVIAEKWFVSCYVSSEKLKIKSFWYFLKSSLFFVFMKSPRNILRLVKFFSKSLV